MKDGDKDYNDSDVRFVQEMIPHHEQAVMMAQGAYARAENREVAEWALAIWEGQESEVEKFRSWLRDRGLPERASGKMAQKGGGKQH